MVYNRPAKLNTLRKEHYDELYARQPQLMERLVPLMTKAEMIEDVTEPRIMKTEPDGKKKLKEKLNIFQHSKKPLKIKEGARINKISDIKLNVLYGLK